jgi:predicted ribosome quality control (RQC) complex YloA/Tae2 family protein
LVYRTNIFRKRKYFSKELIEKIKQIYDYTYTKIKTIDNKDQKIIVCEKSETETDFFKVIEELYLHKNTEETIESKESKQMLKIKNILDTQLETKTEYEKIMSDFEKEGEMIYSYFTLIDQINNKYKLQEVKNRC